MNKVYFHAPNENWIVDEFKKQWDSDPDNNAIKSIRNQYGNLCSIELLPLDFQQISVIWLNASWCWNQLHLEFLKSKKVITTIHHIVDEKFTDHEKKDFFERDKITTCYHVYNTRVWDYIRPLTQKPIQTIQYWADQSYFKKSSLSKKDLRNKHGISNDVYLVGSFQRDSEGAPLARGIIEPKLEKGPDIFCNFVEKLKVHHPNIHVLLAAHRRDYVIKRLIAAKIPYSYYEMPKHEKICELYQCLDLYVVASRTEGGPAALIECGLLDVPVISTPVGISEQVLQPSSINLDLMQAIPAIPNVKSMLLPHGFIPYRKLIDELNSGIPIQSKRNFHIENM